MFVTPESLVDLQSLLSPVNMSSCRTTSSPSSAGKTANLNAFVAAGGGRWITSNAINTYLSEKEEDEYDHLQAKPELGDVKQRGGNKKGRRHAGEALFQRKLSRQAYLVKDILLADGQEAKHVGKKRRARLLSDHLDDFNVSVPYSLNRKNRWDALDDTAVSCLVGCNTPTSLPTTNNQEEPLKFSIVESYFRCNPRDGNRSEQGIRSYQEFNADRQLISRKEASSARGSSLHNLMGSSQDAPGVLTPTTS
uniref:Uncharacterized protein n=1 Tax=Ditylenchus dipsaci TaxID=166011 RepID=A0A915ET77_9BILA